MNETIVERTLDPARALPYVLEQLANSTKPMFVYSDKTDPATGETISSPRQMRGGMALARYLLERSDLDQGVLTTFLPEETPEEDLYKFEQGKLYVDPATFIYIEEPSGQRSRLEPVPNTTPWLASRMSDFLSSGPDKLFVIQNKDIEADSPRLIKEEHLRTIALDGQVYQSLLNADALSAEMIDYTIRTSPSWLFVAVLTSLEELPEWPARPGVTSIDEAPIKALSERAEQIVVEAYHGESYVILTLP